jgi:hypothetical protein
LCPLDATLKNGHETIVAALNAGMVLITPPSGDRAAHTGFVVFPALVNGSGWDTFDSYGGLGWVERRASRGVLARCVASTAGDQQKGMQIAVNGESVAGNLPKIIDRGREK